jgi:hypothetical protein
LRSGSLEYPLREGDQTLMVMRRELLSLVRTRPIEVLSASPRSAHSVMCAMGRCYHSSLKCAVPMKTRFIPGLSNDGSHVFIRTCLAFMALAESISSSQPGHLHPCDPNYDLSQYQRHSSLHVLPAIMDQQATLVQ